jgi:putative membrane-bound dehydrogenase-like protein
MSRIPSLLTVLVAALLLPCCAGPVLAQPPLEAGGFQVLGRPPGHVQSQDMSPFPLGRWQNNDQLWWTGAKPGDRLRLVVPVKKEGTYQVSAILTSAPDYGIVQLSLDGRKLGPPIDLYNPTVISTPPLPLGTHKLSAANHELTVDIVGANPKAIKAYMFGLDCLLFKPPGADKVTFTVPLPVKDLYPYVSLSPEAAAKAMRLPPGFSVRLGAGEPDIRQPIAMALDDRGRLWVAEAYEYPIRARGDKGRDRILIFEDTDGDGHFDKRTVFYEGLNLVSGLEVGFGGVWVGAAPYLLFIPKKADEDRPAGPPQVLLDGFGYHDTHETLNTFTWGPDGWLYGCHGVFTHSRVGKPGTPDNQRVPINAGIWRYHPTQHLFEVFAEGTSNPWGLDFNDQGQAFCTACVIPHLFHIIPGARYQRQAGNHFNPYTYADIQTIADHLHFLGNQWNVTDRRRSDELGGGHAHAGAMIYLGGAWPEKYRTAIFMNNIHGNRINMDWLKPKDSGYVGSHGKDFILTDDQSSQILNLRYGPDGQVWMIDWYDRSQCHVPNAEVPDRSNGRIFQVRYGDVKPVKVDLARLSNEELVKLQLHHNDWYCRHARRLLQERTWAAVQRDLKKQEDRQGSPADPTSNTVLLGRLESKVYAALEHMVLTHPDETRRLRALWTLYATNGLGQELAHKLLASDRPFVRAWTVRLLVDDKFSKVTPATLQKFAHMARHDPSPVVRLDLASALQRLPLASRWDILEGLVSRSQDATDHNLPLMYWYALEPLAGADPHRALALGMIAGENIPLLRDFMVRRIGSATTGKALEMLVEGLGEANRLEQQLAFLRGMNRALVGIRKIAPPATWAAVYAQLQKSRNPEVLQQARALAVTFGDQHAVQQMRAIAMKRQAATDERKQALKSLLGAGVKDLAPDLQALVGDPALRGAALRGLAGYDDPGTAAVILRAYPTLPPAQKRDALATLCSRPAYAQALLGAVGKKDVPATDLSADLVRQIRNLRQPALDKRLAAVWGTVRDSGADKAKLIAQYKKLLQAPPPVAADPSLGRAVFAKTCQQCHTLYGQGGKVGPDITGSNRADLDYLLSNILDPSAIIPKEYVATVVVTSAGRVLTGIVRDSSKNALTLQTANEVVVLPKSEIEETRPSELSMMPEDLLKPLSEHEVRSLVAYLQGRQQVPMRATADNIAGFFDGKDLAGWQGDPSVWSVKDGAIVAQGPTKDSVLVSDLLVGDFELSFEAKVSGEGRGFLVVRGRQMPEGGVEGERVGLGHASWRKIEVVARGSRIQVKSDGEGASKAAVRASSSGIIAVEVSLGQQGEVRLRNLHLRLLPLAGSAARGSSSSSR